MIKPLRTIKQIAWKPKMKVLIRIDGDVAMKGNRVNDDFRIKQALPTIKAVLRHGGRIRIISHRGRPHGLLVSSLTQKPISTCLSRLLRKKITFVKDPFSDAAFKKFNESSDILFFENIRFWKGEEENDALFAHNVARWGDIYINDAFANSHRNHASVLALASILPSYGGMNLEKEVLMLERVMVNPERPLVAILGGAKLETKVPLIKHFLASADHVLIGGAIANTLFVAQGFNVGKSLVDQEGGDRRKFFSHKKLHLPCDVVVTKSLSRPSSMHLCDINDVAPDEYIVDIGTQTLKHFSTLIAGSRMVVWNGPMGFAEMPAFAKGTTHLAGAIRRTRAFKIVGGGDTIALLRTYHVLRGFTYVCTGGGAMLEFLSGKKLSPIEILRQ